MKHCKKCNIDVNTEGHVCPICNDVLVEKKEGNVNKPNGYPQLINKHRFPFVVKLFAFLSIIASIICAFVNYKTFNSEAPSYWSIIVIAGILYCWGIARIFSYKRISFATRFFYLTFFTIIYIVGIDICLTIFKIREVISWSLTYVSPILIIVGLIVIQIVGYASRRNFGDAVMSCFYLTLIALVPYIVYLVAPSYIEGEWAPISGILSGVCTLIGFFIFRFRSTKEELKKRFNI